MRVQATVETLAKLDGGGQHIRGEGTEGRGGRDSQVELEAAPK